MIEVIDKLEVKDILKNELVKIEKLISKREVRTFIELEVMKKLKPIYKVMEKFKIKLNEEIK